MNYQYNTYRNQSNRESPDSPLNMFVGPYNPYNQRRIVSGVNNDYNNKYNQNSNYQNQNRNSYNGNPYVRNFYTPQQRSLSSDYSRQNQNYYNKQNNNFLGQTLQKSGMENLTLYGDKNNGNAFINSSYNIINNNQNSYQKNSNYYLNAQNPIRNNYQNYNSSIQRPISYNPLNLNGKNIIENPYSYNKNPQSQYYQNIQYNNNMNNNNNIYNNYNRNNYNNPTLNYNRNEREKVSLDALTEYDEVNCSAVKEYSYKEDPNRTFRDYMEDKGKSIDCFNNNPDSALFCLFDGHGGKEVSSFLQADFPSYFKTLYNNINEDTVKNLFFQIDEKLKENNYYHVGSTGNIIYITKENNKKILYCANVGDTRSILISNNKVRRLSYDDRADDPNEYSRIINNGGIVFRGRVYGVLMLSRAFADWEFKNYGVICEPHFCKVELNDFDKYVIIASDGVWDVFSDEEMLGLSFKVNNAKEFCNQIIGDSLKKGSTDNLSCFVIKI
jgi:serine/threonine protein phosphatase PrpC